MGIVVFWLEGEEPRSERFEASALSQALARCEDLRRAAAQGAAVSHVCVSSELEGNVTRAGVADAPAGYDWTKRRVRRSLSGRR